MKAKVLISYVDKVSMTRINVGEVVEVSEERLEQINKDRNRLQVVEVKEEKAIPATKELKTVVKTKVKK